MGNWTTVNIEGTCPYNELSNLKEFVNSYAYTDNFQKFHCLCNTKGLSGIGDWAKENIQAVGNLAERDYGAEDVAQELTKIGELCPNADIKIHIGGDYESLDCVNTVHLQKGKVEINPPDKKKLSEISGDQFKKNLLKALYGL